MTLIGYKIFSQIKSEKNFDYNALEKEIEL